MDKNLNLIAKKLVHNPVNKILRQKKLKWLVIK